MPSKPVELPPKVAKAFVRDMRAFHAEKSPIKCDEIKVRSDRADARHSKNRQMKPTASRARGRKNVNHPGISSEPADPDLG